MDVANELGYTKPSVCRAMKLLRGEGLITVAEDGGLKLTNAGAERAKLIYEHHTLLTRFLTDRLGVNPVTAEKDACKIEHVYSEETHLRLKGFMRQKDCEMK